MRSSLFTEIDDYLRVPDTRLGRIVARASSERGVAYATSRPKRALDLLVAAPAAVVSTPLIIVLAGINTLLEPEESTFFAQQRVGHGGTPITILKIRSMPARLMVHAPLLSRGARFRRALRRHYLDELPQLWQVVRGDLSLVGIRVLPPTVYAGLARNWSPHRFARWQRAYETAPLGLSGIHQVFRVGGKQDERRFHRDVFYADHASLGLDLYIIWRTVASQFVRTTAPRACTRRKRTARRDPRHP